MPGPNLDPVRAILNGCPTPLKFVLCLFINSFIIFARCSFFIIKMLIKVKSPNIINIAAGEEVIPQLLQSKCNPRDIFKTVDRLLNDKKILEKQVNKSQEIINTFKKAKSSEIASSVLLNQL